MESALAAAAVVFVAELGDRTQLLIVSLASRHRAAPVVGGVVLGYLLTTVVSVTVGSALGAALPQRPVEIVSGLLFLAFAVWTLVDVADDDEDAGLESAATGVGAETDEGSGRHRGVGLAVSLAGAIVVSEIGDKSMLATATLAADRGAPVAVGIGALVGILAAGLLGVAAGRVLADRVPERTLRWVAASLFAAFGVVLLLGLG